MSRHCLFILLLLSFLFFLKIIMMGIDTKRMTLRLPETLQKRLGDAIVNSSSTSITAEIINRLEKSFDLNPANSDDELTKIRQYSSHILNLVSSIETKNPNIFGDEEIGVNQLSKTEELLLASLNTLSIEQQSKIIPVLITIITDCYKA
jgi:hypothetical protein